MYSSVFQPHKQTLTWVAICVALFWGSVLVYDIQRFKNRQEYEAMAKVKYQTLVGEFLELQKDFVSRKRKLHAAKQKRDTILAEVRFLRRRLNDLLQNEAFNTEKDPVHLSNSYLKSKALKGELCFDGPEAMPENSNRFLLSDSHNGDTDQGVRDNEVLDLKPMDGIIHQKTAGKRKISCLIKSR